MSQIGISVDYRADKILIEFDRDVRHIELTPKQASDLAKAIAEKTLNASGQPRQTNSGLIVPSVMN